MNPLSCSTACSYADACFSFGSAGKAGRLRLFRFLHPSNLLIQRSWSRKGFIYWRALLFCHQPDVYRVPALLIPTVYRSKRFVRPTGLFDDCHVCHHVLVCSHCIQLLCRCCGWPLDDEELLLLAQQNQRLSILVNFCFNPGQDVLNRTFLSTSTT